MKKIISIAFAAILAGLAISCQKEEAVSDKADAVQYTFNITVADQVGFESDVSTKKASAPTYKSAWEDGDRIFLFFKPTSGSLLGDRYATLTYNGSSWVGTVTEGQSNLGNGGTLSAVYVYKLDGSVTPAYSDSKWTIPTGNTFYNCQTGSYTVSGDVISASLDLKAPADFVCFSIYDTSGDALTCNNVKGWKDVVIGSEMTFSNATCTGYMTGFDNVGNSRYKDYYGRIVGGGTSLNGLTCNFSVVKDGKVYERTATPSSDKRSFYMDRRATGDKEWKEAAGKLPGLFTVGKGADDKAGTVDDVQVRFSKGNLVAAIDSNGAPKDWKFATNQYDCIGEGGANKTIGNTSTSGTAGDVDLFGWSTSSDNYGIKTSTSFKDYSGEFYDWGKAYCEKNSITPDNTWRTLSTEEWQYLFSYDGSGSGGQNYDNNIRRGKYKYGVTVCGKTNCVVLLPDNWQWDASTVGTDWQKNTSDIIEYSEETTVKWSTMHAAGAVCLPATGNRSGSNVYSVGDFGLYWSSTESSSSYAYRVFFNSSSVSPDSNDSRKYGYSVRLITESK